MNDEVASRFGPKVAAIGVDRSVAEPLLVYLRESARSPQLSYASEPTRITGGFDTAIWSFRLEGMDGAWAGPLILRVYRDGGADQALFEAAVQNAVSAQLFPTPPVLAVCVDINILGSAFTVMPRVPGVPTLERILSPALPKIPALLGRLQAELHALDPEPVRRALSNAGFSNGHAGLTDFATWRDEIERAHLNGLLGAHAWLETHAPAPCPAPVVCHGDFHPLNVLMDGERISGVLDWPGMRIADPAWDLGAGVALFGQGPIDLPGVLVPVVSVVRSWMLRRYVRAYLAVRPLDINAVRYYEAMRLLGFMIETGIYRQARAGVIPPSSKPAAFNPPRVLAGITKRFRAITGIAVSMPPYTE